MIHGTELGRWSPRLLVIFGGTILIALMTFQIATMYACTPKQEMQAARTAGDLGACVIAELGEDEDAISKACGVTAEDVHKIFAAESKRLAKMKSAAPPCAASSSSSVAP